MLGHCGIQHFHQLVPAEAVFLPLIELNHFFNGFPGGALALCLYAAKLVDEEKAHPDEMANLFVWMRLL